MFAYDQNSKRGDYLKYEGHLFVKEIFWYSDIQRLLLSCKCCELALNFISLNSFWRIPHELQNENNKILWIRIA